jgi:hypothetical protein
VGPLVLAQAGVGCPGGAGGAQQVVVRGQAQGPPGLGRGAPGAQRAGTAGGAEDDMTARGIVRVMPAGQVTVPFSSSTAKSSAVNPPGTAGCNALGLRAIVTAVIALGHPQVQDNLLQLGSGDPFCSARLT